MCMSLNCGRKSEHSEEIHRENIQTQGSYQKPFFFKGNSANHHRTAYRFYLLEKSDYYSSLICSTMGLACLHRLVKFLLGQKAQEFLNVNILSRGTCKSKIKFNTLFGEENSMH